MSDVVEIKLGRVLLAYRSTLNMSGKELALEIGIPASKLSRLERGRSADMNAATLVKIVAWLCK